MKRLKRTSFTINIKDAPDEKYEKLIDFDNHRNDSNLKVSFESDITILTSSGGKEAGVTLYPTNCFLVSYGFLDQVLFFFVFL